MNPIPPAQPPPAPSAGAQKYGGNAKWNDLRSGFTPTGSVFPTNRFSNPSATSSIEETEAFQRKELEGFTVRELIELDALSSRPLKTPDLQNTIVPFLSLDPTFEPDPDDPMNPIEYETTWDDGTQSTRPAAYPPVFAEGDVKEDDDGMDEDGNEKVMRYWTPQIPEVRRILEPILVLASRLYETSAYTQFFDLCLFAKKYPVESTRIPSRVKFPPDDYDGPKADELVQITTKWDVTIQERARHEKEEVSRLLRHYLRIGFEAERDPFTGDLLDRLVYGCTRVQPEHASPVDLIFISLNTRTYKPLLRDDLTDAERLGLYWQNATTILHECAHAFSFLSSMRENQGIDGEMDIPNINEPYFEDQCVAEMGWAMEFGVGEGMIAEMLGDGRPPLGLFRNIEFPTTEHSALLPDVVVLLAPRLKLRRKVFPVPIALIEGVHQESFWQTISTFRSKIHDMISSPIGAQIHLTVGGKNTSKRWRISTDSESRVEQIMSLIKMNAKQREAVVSGEEFLQGALSGAKYWDTAREQNKEATSILEEIQKYHESKNSSQRIETAEAKAFYVRICALLQNTVQAHSNKIEALYSMEQDGKGSWKAYTPQRADLIAFNRGTRGFLKSLEETIASVSNPLIPQPTKYDDLLDSMRAISQHLDSCYLELWDPVNPLEPDCDDAKEDKQMEDLHNLANSGDPTIAARCQQVLTSNPCLSGFNMCLVKIIYCACVTDVTVLAKLDRTNMLTKTREYLTTLRVEPKLMGGCPTWWLHLLQQWINNADIVLNSINPRKRQRNDDDMDVDDDRPSTRPRLL